MEGKIYPVIHASKCMGNIKHLVIVTQEAIPDVFIGSVLIVPFAEGFQTPTSVKVAVDDNGKPLAANNKFAVVLEYYFD